MFRLKLVANELDEIAKELPSIFNMFVNRKKEKKWFEDLLDKKRSDVHLVEYVGIAGQGKTFLLQYFYNSAIRKDEECLAGYLDLQRGRFSGQDVQPILEEIIYELSQQKKEARTYFNALNGQLKAYSQLKDPDGNEQESIDCARDVLEHFRSCLTELSSFYKVVLCFDNTDCLKPAVIRQLEEHLFEPLLLNQENLILVFAGQQKVYWKNRRVRRLIRQEKLKPLSQDDIEELIDRLLPQNKLPVKNKSCLLEKICQLTLGHPFSSYKFLDFLSEGFCKSLTNEVIEKHYSRSIEELVERVVKKRILQDLELSSDYPPPEIILCYLAPLRRIEFSTFHFILSRFLPNWFKDKPFGFFEDLITEFQKHTCIFTPWILGAGFDVEEVTRSILLSDLRVNNKKKFIEIQQVLIEQYERWIEQTSDASQVKNIIERLYHTVLLMKAEKKEKIPEKIAEKMNEYLKRYLNKEYTGSELKVCDQVNRLKNALQKDGELCQLTDISILLEVVGSM